MDVDCMACCTTKMRTSTSFRCRRAIQKPGPAEKNPNMHVLCQPSSMNIFFAINCMARRDLRYRQAEELDSSTTDPCFSWQIPCFFGTPLGTTSYARPEHMRPRTAPRRSSDAFGAVPGMRLPACGSESFRGQPKGGFRTLGEHCLVPAIEKARV